MVRNHDGHIARMRHLAAGICRTGDGVFVTARQGQPDTGDLGPVQNAGQLLGKGAQRDGRRRDQVNLRLLGGVHGRVLRLSVLRAV